MLRVSNCLFIGIIVCLITVIAAAPVFAQLGSRPNKVGNYKCWACGGRGYDSAGNPCTYCSGVGVRNYRSDRNPNAPSQGYSPRYYRKPGAQSCFVATAAYGTPWEENVLKLRYFRERYLLTNSIGKHFVDFYYRHSPPLADAITEKPLARWGARVALTPFVIVAGAALGNVKDIILLMSAAILIFVTVRYIRKKRKLGIKRVSLSNTVA